MKAIREVFIRYKQEYGRSGKTQKTAVLNTVCETTGLHRKAAIRKFKRLRMTVQYPTEHRGRPMKYGADVTAALYDVWEVGAQCYAELLHGEIGIYIAALVFL